MTFITQLINNMQEQKDIIEELIKIDNEHMNDHITFDNYITSLQKINQNNINFFKLYQDTLFITEGNPLLTIDILRRLDDKNNYIIFINQGYIAMNKWIIKEYNIITGNNRIAIDTNINYNDYINLNYNVIPIGEEELIAIVKEDFHD